MMTLMPITCMYKAFHTAFVWPNIPKYLPSGKDIAVEKKSWFLMVCDQQLQALFPIEGRDINTGLSRNTGYWSNPSVSVGLF
jgi:hypothetical protein